MKVNMLKSTLVLLAVLGLTACGKTEQEIRHDEVVKAQSLGCIDSEKAVAYEKDANMETKNLIDVCFEKERQRKAEVYKQEEAQRQARLAEIQKEQQKLALEQQKLQVQQQYGRPIAPGEYQSRVGDSNCGFWNNYGEWQWYPNMTQCKEETDNYLAYAVFAGLIGAEVIDEIFDRRTYNKHSHYKPVKVKDYYSQNGRVVTQKDYQKDYSVYNTRKSSNVTGYKKEVKEPKKYDSSLYGSSKPVEVKKQVEVKKEEPKKYDSSLYGTSTQVEIKKPVEVKKEEPKKYSSNLYGGSKPVEVKKQVEVKKEEPKKYNSNLFGNSSSANKKSTTSSSNKKSSSSSSSSSKKSGGGRKPR